jgi:hypothetical protein
MTISIPIISDFDGKGIKKAIAQFKELETTGEKAQFLLKKAAIPAAAALGGLAVAAKGAVEAASNMAEAQSKVNVIFGEGAAEIAKYSKTASSRIGQSKQAVMDAAGTFGTFGKAAGLGGKDLAKFATGFTGLASDLASFNNTSPEEAILAIGAGLRGESEPLRRFGVLLNDATLKQEAMKLGIYDGNGALTAQQKILAAQAAIYNQTTDAQGDFARTSDGLANSQRTLKAQFDDMQVSLGQALLPVVDALLPKVKAFADWAAANPGTFKLIAAAITAIAVAVVAVNAAMAINPFTAIAAGIALLVVGLVTAYNKFETFRDVVRTVVNGIASYFEFMVNAWIKAINVVIRGINLVKPGKDIPSLGNVGFGRLGEDASPTVGGGARIPAMANGGIVTSPTLALIGEAGPEAVVPLNRAGNMGGITVNVHGADPNAVVNTLRRYMSSNGTLPVRVA